MSTIAAAAPALRASGVWVTSARRRARVGGTGRTRAPRASASRFAARAAADEEEPMEIALKVEGMMCEGCAESVTAALTDTGKVKDVKVDLDAKLVSVFVECETMMDGLAMIPSLVEAVKGAGFEAEPEF